MDSNSQPSRVTNSAGDIDPHGDIVGCLWQRIGTTIDPGPYEERPGLDERMTAAGADPAALRRMLRVAR